jgi:hypothetical protein
MILPCSLYQELCNCFDRQPARDRIKEILGREYDLFRVQVGRGGRVLNSVCNTVPYFLLRDATAALLWQFLEALDGFDELVRAGNLGAAEIVGRTVLEDGLQLIYLLEQGDQRIALAYEVDRIRRNGWKEASPKLPHGPNASSSTAAADHS